MEKLLIYTTSIEVVNKLKKDIVVAVQLASGGQTWALGPPAADPLMYVIEFCSSPLFAKGGVAKLHILRKTECLPETCWSGLSHNCDNGITFAAIIHLVISQPEAAIRAAPVSLRYTASARSACV